MWTYKNYWTRELYTSLWLLRLPSRWCRCLAGWANGDRGGARNVWNGTDHDEIMMEFVRAMKSTSSQISNPRCDSNGTAVRGSVHWWKRAFAPGLFKVGSSTEAADDSPTITIFGQFWPIWPITRCYEDLWRHETFATQFPFASVYRRTVAWLSFDMFPCRAEDGDGSRLEAVDQNRRQMADVEMINWYFMNIDDHGSFSAKRDRLTMLQQRCNVNLSYICSSFKWSWITCQAQIWGLSYLLSFLFR